MILEPKNAKQIALESAMRNIEKEFGPGAAMWWGQKGTDSTLEIVPSGSLGLDGMPYSRIVEIYGPESSGKTTIALEIIAQVQKQGGHCVFVDTEHAFDPIYASKIGVQLAGNNGLIISQPNNGEEALEIVDTFIRSQAVKLVVLDSVAALVPKAELEGEMGDSHMGLQARLMSQALRKLTPAVSKYGAMVIFINQIRQKIGVMFGNPETTTGGNALKFYASIRLDVRRISTLKRGEELYGNQVRVKVVKNKVAPPFKTVDFEIHYGIGICKVSEIIQLGTKFGFIKKSGSWYSCGEDKIGQGQDAVKKYLDMNPEVQKDLESRIKAVGLEAIQTITEDTLLSDDEESSTKKENKEDQVMAEVG